MGKRVPTVRYRVSRGRARMWDVFEVGVQTAVASFHRRADATAYARRLAAARGRAHVEIDEEPAPRAA